MYIITGKPTKINIGEFRALVYAMVCMSGTGLMELCATKHRLRKYSDFRCQWKPGWMFKKN